MNIAVTQKVKAVALAFTLAASILVGFASSADARCIEYEHHDVTAPPHCQPAPAQEAPDTGVFHWKTGTVSGSNAVGSTNAHG